MQFEDVDCFSVPAEKYIFSQTNQICRSQRGLICVHRR